MCGHTLAAPSPACTSAPSVPAAGAPPGRAAPRLWIGSYANAARPAALRSLGVTHVLSLVPGGGALYPLSFTYACMPPGNPDLAAAVGTIGEDKKAEAERARVFALRARLSPPAG